MRLDDLMKEVFQQANVTLSQVQDAIKEHMFHDNDSGGALRFSMTSEPDGVYVKVMPKRGGGTGQIPQTGPSGGHWNAGGRWDAGRVGRSSRAGSNVVRMRGSVAQAARAPKSDWQPAPRKVANAANPTQLAAKLDMSLDDVIRSDRVEHVSEAPRLRQPVADIPPWHREPSQVPEAPRPARRANRASAAMASSAGDRPSHARVRRCFDQMGLTPDTQHIRQAPGIRGERRGHRGAQRNWEGRDRYSPAERVQRWMAWLLKKGYEERGVEVKDGWASLREMAAQISVEKQLEFGECDEAKLAKLIRETDGEGRFEISGSHIRKLPKEQRANAGGTENGSRKVGDNRVGAANAESQLIRSGSMSSDSEDGYHHDARRITGAGSRSPSQCSDRMDDDIGALADRAHMMHLAGEVEVVDAEHADSIRVKLEQHSAPSPEHDGRCPKPPGLNGGPHWTKFKDDDTCWWYYEGPLGKWWCGEEPGSQPEPYADEDE